MLYILLAGTLLSRLGEEDGVASGGDLFGTGSSGGGSVNEVCEHAMIVREGRNMCGAAVGTKGKVCTKPRGSCHVVSHVHKAVEEGLFIRSGDFKV